MVAYNGSALAVSAQRTFKLVKWTLANFSRFFIIHFVDNLCSEQEHEIKRCVEAKLHLVALEYLWLIKRKDWDEGSCGPRQGGEHFAAVKSEGEVFRRGDEPGSAEDNLD